MSNRKLTNEQQKTYQSIITEPAPANLAWSKIRDLLEALPGFKVRQFSDRLFVLVKWSEISEVTTVLEERSRTGVFHCPSGQKCAAPCHVRAIRDFLETVEIERGTEF